MSKGADGSRRPWVAETAIDAAAAGEAIATRFPRLAPVTARKIGDGWDNTVFRVNDAWVFRFPRRRVAVESLEKEWRILPLLSGRLPCPVPRPIFRGEPVAPFPWPFVGHRFLPGTTACRAGLDRTQRAALSAPLGHFLAALHAIGADVVSPEDAGLDTIGRMDVGSRLPRARADLERVAALRISSDARAALEALEDSVSRAASPPPRTVLTHGDLYARQVLVNSRAALCGVIDWGDVHHGDPAVDIAIAHSFLPPPARAAFRSAYGEIDEETWHRARFRAICQVAILVLYAHDVQDDALLREGRLALEAIAGGA